MTPVAAVHGCSPELDGKTLLLQTSHTLFTGFGEAELALSRKSPLCSLVFIELQVLLVMTSESYSEDQPGKSRMSVLQQWSGCYGAIKHFLIGCKAHFLGGNSWLV